MENKYLRTAHGLNDGVTGVLVKWVCHSRTTITIVICRMATEFELFSFNGIFSPDYVQVDPTSNAHKYLQKGDVVTHFDNEPIANDGTVRYVSIMGKYFIPRHSFRSLLTLAL